MSSNWESVVGKVLLGDQERGVESNTELSNQLGVGLRGLLDKLASARLGHTSQVVDEIVFGHTNTSIADV